MRSSSGAGMVGCGQTSATWLPSTMPSPPSTRPNGSRERRSSAFLREDSGIAQRPPAQRNLDLIMERRAPDEVYAEVRKEFGEEELVNLSLAIITINGWNRLAIGFRKIPGEYQPQDRLSRLSPHITPKDRGDA